MHSQRLLLTLPDDLHNTVRLLIKHMERLHHFPNRTEEKHSEFSLFRRKCLRYMVLKLFYIRRFHQISFLFCQKNAIFHFLKNPQTKSHWQESPLHPTQTIDLLTLFPMFLFLLDHFPALFPFAHPVVTLLLFHQLLQLLFLALLQCFPLPQPALDSSALHSVKAPPSPEHHPESQLYSDFQQHTLPVDQW